MYKFESEEPVDRDRSRETARITEELVLYYTDCKRLSDV